MINWRPTQRKNAGFTLLEALVVIALLVAIFALSYSQFRTPSGSIVLRTAAHQMCTALQTARSRAIASNGEVIVSINLASRSYRIGSAADVNLPRGTDIKLIVADEQQGHRGVGRYHFYPTGASSGGEIRISDGVRAVEISVNWLTGIAICRL